MYTYLKGSKSIFTPIWCLLMYICICIKAHTVNNLILKIIKIAYNGIECAINQ